MHFKSKYFAFNIFYRYYPHVKEFLPPSDIESREFNNPLYRQSIVEPVKPNTQEIDKFKTSRMEPTMSKLFFRRFLLFFAFIVLC